MPFLCTVRVPHAKLRYCFSFLGRRGIGQGQWVSVSRLNTHGYSTNTGQEPDAASTSSIEPDQTPAPSVDDVEWDVTSAPSTNPNEAPASSFPDTELDTKSAPTTETNQEPTPSTSIPIQWTWKTPHLSPPPPPPRIPDVPKFSALGEEVRRAMRAFPHALAVVTSKTPIGLTRGLVVSSFSTVTIHPTPYVTFNIKLPSATYDAIARSRRFTITTIWSVETAKAFANPNKQHRIPLKESDPRSLEVGGLFSMDCLWDRAKSPRVRDHVIMLGRVEEYRPGRPQNITKSPLLYVNGDYQPGPRTEP